MISTQLRHVGKLTTQLKSIRVGLTGGMASGKTLVAAMLEICGAPVTFADQMAKGLMEMPGEVKNELIEIFGPGIYLPDGRLDRPKLGGIIFKNDELLTQVNQIVHPAVRKAAQDWHNRNAQDAQYTVYESALLFESGAAEEFDVVVHVHAAQHVRIKRAMSRDGLSSEDVHARLSAQWSDQQRLDQKAYIIINDGSRMLIPQVYELHKALSQNGQHH